MKTAYLDFLEDKNDEYVSFALVYIDNDDIPELYMNGVCEATGDSICSYEYSVEEKAVNEEEYNKAKNSAFDYEQSVKLGGNTVTYDVIKQQILDLQ